MGVIVAVDTGGTFTDLVAYDTDSGEIRYTKSLTSYQDFVAGVVTALAKAGVDLSRAILVKFGTTLVINTFVQRNGARTALLTTEGFRDVLQVRRGNRPFPFDLHYHRDPILVEREARFEVRERLAADGGVVTALEPDSVARIAETLDRQGFEAVAVSFINAYARTDHEDQAAAILAERLPHLYVTKGTELSREWYEYERTSTAVANAYVGPRLRDYVRRLESRLRREGLRQSFFMMASSGGVFAAERAEKQPVMLLESGPVGGCIGACAYAKALSIPRLIALDMGGTTAKCVVVEDGSFEIRSPYYVGGYKYGFPIHGAVLDIVEVGAGGGSIARLDAHRRLSVGPISAGSDPGPVAYGRGGAEPTITDANVTLGRIDAQSFLGGEMPLDAAAARAAIRDAIAAPLEFAGERGIDEAASGIVALGVATMAGAIRQVTVERGLDPRDFSLFAFGGGGPLHAATLARQLNIPEVIVPPEPGNFSAIGMLVSDARIDESRTFLRPLTADSLAEMAAMFSALEEAAAQKLAGETGAADVVFDRVAEMRYLGQKQGLRTGIGARISPTDIRDLFDAAYLKRFGHVDRGSPIEFVSLSLTASAGMRRPGLQHIRPRRPVSDAQPPLSRPVYFPERGRRIDTAVFQRSRLPRGFSRQGPAVIEEYGSTTVVGPEDHFRVGELFELRITLEPGP